MIDFTLRELECFIAVAEELHFSRAARRLHLAQPPLSRHIRTLEGRLGARLFERTRRRVELTGPGGAFYDEVCDILPRLQRAQLTVRRTAAGESGRLRLGFVGALLNPGLAAVLRHYRAQHPRVRLDLVDLAPAAQLAALEAGELDGGFIGVRPLHRRSGLRVETWRRERVLAFLSPDDPLASQAGVRLAQLREVPFAMVSAAAAPAFHARFHEWCARAGFRPRVVHQSDRVQAVLLSVSTGGAVALLPESLAGLLPGAIVTRPLSPRTSLELAFVSRSGTASAEMRDLVALLRSPASGNRFTA